MTAKKKTESIRYPSGFPFRLIHKEGNDKKVCYFQCKEHMNKYILRAKLKKKDYVLTIQSEDEKETQQNAEE